MSPSPEVDAPSFAVVTATKNRPALLRKSMEAIAAQTVKPLEVVVVNDGGEPLGDALEALRFPVQVLENPVSLGQPAALNRGVRATTSRYVAFCDDDDLFAPDHLETLARGLSATAAGLAYTDVQAFATDPARSLGVLDRDFDPAMLRVTNYITPSASAFSRALYDRLQGLDESLSIYWDWDFFLRVAAVASIVHVAGGATHYRVHPGSIQTTTSGQDRADQLQRLCDKHGLGTLPVKHLFDNFRKPKG
jgi:glycosyltransferase involved in cell wall biosynthesis